MSVDITAENLIELIKAVGLVKGVFVAFFFIMHGWVFSLYNGRLKDRQKEIDRMAADNREYRERLLDLMDKNFGYTKPKPKQKTTNSKGGK